MRFWRYHIRYRLARAMIHLALKIWPPGRGRDEVTEFLWVWRSKVTAEVAARNSITPWGLA